MPPAQQRYVHAALQRCLDVVSPTDGVKSVHLQSDYANLRHMQEQLEGALKESKTAHCQRFSRYIR